MRLQDADIILLERFLVYFGGTVWIVAMLELPIAAQLELLCRFIHVFSQESGRNSPFS